ncbi:MULTISPECIES: AAA family ATPase [unclassified Prochlorococcus]|uniref:AAA family ATPase n=1 Tax=unclassified Prochlorococcus TaxID=2627481 RepID=UPI0005339323|nr:MULTISPECIES: AAA family ATPase [unclassified Prochlorococcus]KGG15453.1 DNA helicase related to phage enzyme [Prochlorococcus sp. MIT 0602]KGG17732.1 DNA helicase related to phage enzyme [Prochlorococcus sp. MIT 0603]
MTKKPKLSTDQSNALEEFIYWLEKKVVEGPFLLSGFAGSGKTYLARKFLKIVEDKSICWTVAAPTHKAVGVLRNALEKEGLRPTWHPSTLHRLLRLKLQRKGDLEICERTDQTEKSLDQIGLVLIDEASMIDSKLLEIVITCAYIYKTRLVFIGDPAQLPPVGEKSSPVFLINRATKSHLSEVIRHKGELLKLASVIRERTFPCIQPPCFSSGESKHGVIGALDQKSWLEKAKSSLRMAALSDQPDAARILCYTNSFLERLVPHARRAVHGEMADQMSVLPGEILISRRAVMTAASIESNGVEEEPGILFGSNTEIVVEEVSNEIFNCSDIDFEIEYEVEIPQLHILVAKVRASSSKSVIRLMPEIGTNSRFLLEDLMRNLCDKAKTLPKKEARLFWRNYFHLRDSFAFVGPASVLTVHRSQGSTFEKVFVASDVFWAKDISLRRQLAYVAISRASKEVWLAGDNSLKLLNNPWTNSII